MFPGFTQRHYQMSFEAIEDLLAKDPKMQFCSKTERIVGIDVPRSGRDRYLDIFTLRQPEDRNEEDPQGTEPQVDYQEKYQEANKQLAQANARIRAITEWVRQLPAEAKLDMPELQS